MRVQSSSCLRRITWRRLKLPFNLFSCLEVTLIYRLCPDSLGSRRLISVLLPDTTLQNSYFKVLWTSITWYLHLKYHSEYSPCCHEGIFRNDGKIWVPYLEPWLPGHFPYPPWGYHKATPLLLHRENLEQQESKECVLIHLTSKWSSTGLT